MCLSVPLVACSGGSQLPCHNQPQERPTWWGSEDACWQPCEWHCKGILLSLRRPRPPAIWDPDVPGSLRLHRWPSETVCDNVFILKSVPGTVCFTAKITKYPRDYVNLGFKEEVRTCAVRSDCMRAPWGEYNAKKGLETEPEIRKWRSTARGD